MSSLTCWIRARWLAGVAGLMSCLAGVGMADEIDGFATRGEFREQVREWRFEPEVSVRVVAPPVEEFDAGTTTTLVVYALPNGNSTDWTVGRRMHEGLDWHYDIQHVGAQIRAVRAAMPGENVVVAYLEADGRSWPSWRQRHENSSALIVDLLEQVESMVPGDPVRVVLTGHSGGGSLTFGMLNGVERVPDSIVRIAFLDSNYAYSTDSGHGDKLLEWLGRDRENFLFVMAYDDRRIEIEGRRVVSETGGTWRSTHRMIDRFREDVSLEESTLGSYVRYGASGIEMLLHPNPKNEILHTVMVGEYNGLMHALTVGTPLEGTVCSVEGPRAYERFIAEVE